MSARRIVIVGNGVAGATAALELRARDERCEITLVSDESDYFFSRTALMYALMEQLPRKGLEPFERHVWDRQRITRVRARVRDLHAEQRTITLDDGRSLAYDALVLATGARGRRLDTPGVERVRHGLSTFVTMSDLDRCESLIRRSDRAVVVGGGLIGVELVECLLHHGVKTTFVVREQSYWPQGLGAPEAAIVHEHLRAKGVDLQLDRSLATIEADDEGRVRGVTLSSGERVPCAMLGACIGVEPNVQWLRACASAPVIDRAILVNDRLQTSLPSVWAAGDCAAIRVDDRRVYEPIWYTARRHGAFVARQLSGSSERYRAPVFKNSAKFFELEYSAVGDCDPRAHASVALAHPRKPIVARLYHRDAVFTGFSAVGSRWDTTRLAEWVEQARPLEWVRARLRDAQFDPEFSRARIEQMTEVRS